MKRVFALLSVLLMAMELQAQFRTSLADLDDSETVHAFKEHVATLSAAQMEGRLSGSEGERMAAQYLREKLEEFGIDLLTAGQDFKLAGSPDTLTSQNVVGVLQGWDQEKNQHYIVIGARMDNLGTDTYTVDGKRVNRIYYGANGNASGMAMLLELARRLSYARGMLRRSVVFVGFGASAQSFAGSWYFLNRSFRSDADKIDAMVNLDMLGTAKAGGLLAYTASNEDLNTLVHTLQGELLPIQAQLVTQAPYPGDHIVFYDKQIPSVLFTSGRYPEHATGRDSYDIIDFEGMERELEYIYSYLLQLCNGARPLWRNGESARQEEMPAGVYAYSDVDVKPLFLNSADPRSFMEQWVYPYLKYPKYAADNGIQGRVLVEFVVDEKGDVKDVKLVRGVHQSLDDEALRVVSASPRWRPGLHHGKKVKVAMTVSVEFRLQKDGGKFGINGVKIN